MSDHMASMVESARALAWDVRVGRVLTQCLSAGFRYGPLSRRWRSGALVVGANWARNRRPARGIERALGSDPAKWHSPCAACSPFVEVVLRLAYDLRGDEWSIISKSTAKALARPGLAECTRDAHPKRYRAFDLDNLPSPLPEPLCVVLYRGHVVLLVDCDRIPVVRDGRRLGGIYVIGADGTFDDVKNETGILVRRYSLQPLTCEPVAERAKRQRSRPDRSRMVAIVGMAPPERIPSQPARLIVERA